MKAKRQKHVRRTLIFFKNHFGFVPPFNIVVDGTFCKAALKFKVNISEQLPKYVDAEVKIFTTNCVLQECEALGPLLYGPLKVLRQFHVCPCGHQEPVPAYRCLRQLAKRSKTKLLIATQDPDLSDKLRQIAGTPILFISHNAITLEGPSETSKKKASTVEHDKLTPTGAQHNRLEAMKTATFGDNNDKPMKKKKGRVGPNPLSCKKKKKQKKETAVKDGGTKPNRRKRKRIKVAKHVKEHWLQECKRAAPTSGPS